MLSGQSLERKIAQNKGYFMKKVVIITSSLRVNSNSDLLAESFKEGAVSAGNEVEVISLKGKKLAFCMGCFACQKLGRCVINDDANAIMEKICEADVVVWATPTYYYTMSGNMKTLIDRCNALFSKEYKFREVYLLTTATEDEEFTPKQVIGGVQGWVDCFEGVKFVDTLFVGGVTDPGEIKNNPGLKKAFEMGKNV